MNVKKQLNRKQRIVSGTVQSTIKGFGFLIMNSKKSYFIPSTYMKKVMHGDKITATIRTEKNREIADPEDLIKPFLKSFVGKVEVKYKYIIIIPDHPLIKNIITIQTPIKIKKKIHTGDWVMAEMQGYFLKNKINFFAEITEIITKFSDNFAPWWVTLSRYKLARSAPDMPKEGLSIQIPDLQRNDLTNINFFTIDNDNTKDIDDAIHLSIDSKKNWVMTVAIADPSAWIPEESTLDLIARERAFTHYLPGLNIPMLPRILSEDLCSLLVNKKRPVLACRIKIKKNGEFCGKAQFFTAWIKVKANLVYENVSKWLENNGSWIPKTYEIANQIKLLHELAKARFLWRKRYALVFQNQPEYKFITDKIGNVNNIVIKKKVLAHHMIEEAMITVNICAAYILRDNIGYGLYNVHSGFNPILIHRVVTILKKHHICVNSKELLTLKGFCDLRRKLSALPNKYLNNLLHRLQSTSKIKTTPSPHFGLGLEIYATWTSPIRKYGDMLNHRILKTFINIGKISNKFNKNLILKLVESRRKKRIAKKDIENWLYARFLLSKVGSNICFLSEIINIIRNGIRVRLIDNGAIAFIPYHFINFMRDKIIYNEDIETLQIKGGKFYKQGDIIPINIVEVRMDYKFIIVRPTSSHI